MKASRAAIVLNLLRCCWNMYVALRNSHIDGRVCSRVDERGAKRSDKDRAQCDTWNLGCLIQHFSPLNDPQIQQYYGSVDAIMRSLVIMSCYQAQYEPVNSHTRSCSCGGDLRPRLEFHLAKVKGLKLPD